MTDITRSPPRALAFDIYGTVVDWRGAVVRELTALVERDGLAIDTESAAQAWRRERADAISAIRRGSRPWTSMAELLGETISALLETQIGSRPDQDTLGSLVRSWDHADAWPDSPNALHRLRGRFVCITLSNGDVASLVRLSRRAGLVWDAVLCAELFRHYKPDREVYLGAARLLGLTPEKILMVASHAYDLAAARDAGMATAFVRRPGEVGGPLGDRGEPQASWDLVVDDLEELAIRLRC